MILLYADDLLRLADKKEEQPFEYDDALFEEAANDIYEAGGFNVEQLDYPSARAVINETARVFNTAIDSGLPHEVPDNVRHALEQNAFVFSGFKTYHSLREVGLALTNDKGEIKPFGEFKEDVQKINAKYNHNYLYAEYNHAVGSSLMASKWKDLEADGDRYDLQYRTAGDERVRETHALLHNTTLPANDPFWDSYYPPNGWNCRCTVVQVRKGKYERTDPELAMKRGENCTDGVKQRMFRYNAGKSMELFPPKHPYKKAPKEVKKVVEKVSAEEMQKKRIAEFIAELPNNLTDEQKQAIAAHCIELEKALGLTKGKRMSVDEADKQNANPNYGKSSGYGINCQTCTPAYILRTLGFDVSAKPNTKGSKLEYLSMGFNAWEVWKNTDGTPAKHISVNIWLSAKKYKTMTAKRWLQYFDETCKEVGIYGLSIGWKRGGHMTILQRFENGELRYIEPQHDNSAGSGREYCDLNYLAKHGAARQHDCRGIMRIDDKLFNLDHIEIFDK